jgi:predicted nucleic acid-binding Zn ribbon protein
MVSAEKLCPGCGKPVYSPDRTYCTMRCADAHEKQKRSAVEREVAALMRQYHEGRWEPVALGKISGRHRSDR